jgi:hypothetical protein
LEIVKIDDAICRCSNAGERLFTIGDVLQAPAHGGAFEKGRYA